jgi:hypothetical protein
MYSNDTLLKHVLMRIEWYLICGCVYFQFLSGHNIGQLDISIEGVAHIQWVSG